MTTHVRDAPSRERYEIVVDDQVAGYSTYRRDGDRLTFTHTEVDDAYAGRGLGKELVTGLLDEADREELAVVPACGFVRKVIERDPDRYLHLVPQDARVQFGLEP